MRTAARRRVRPCVARLLATPASRAVRALTRLAIRRRSVSSCVSPGPRRPMPPFWRSRWVHPPTSRVAMCFSWASSTCSLPSLLRARCAKMSRIRLVRSTTRQPSACSRLRCCTPESGWSKITSSADVSPLRAPISSTLPLPAKVAGSGRLRLPVMRPTTSAPADAARAASSFMRSSMWPSPRSSSTRSARLPPSGRSNMSAVPAQSALARGAASHQPSVSPAGAWWGIVTGRDGTTVEIACL